MGAPAIKEPEQWTRTSVTLPNRVWEKLDKTLDVVNSTRPPPERYTRDRFMAEMLDWACKELALERTAKKKAGTGS